MRCTILLPSANPASEIATCETTLQGVVSEWKLAISKGGKVGVVFLDYRRAFETIDRKILIAKLEFLGLKGTVISWLQDKYK